ncbi:type II toxin-antitoxin system PrlF family antitoxin [Rhabdochromatium marinum]|uniref:type II toxin-antitoxin system PrlF family antitoxin n=1 Tax=Rhabdochromatium marinum TaxID=48729 RepID=UPI001908E079|nr:type II toxin-antitoxin system PrlF family antitoxin [Rhabdochromatium marinum]MBK1649790.1 regulator [Rhabdochromatium marinum]
MPATLEAESTLTARYQTTVPETVRRALQLSKRDKIHYSIRANGEVVLTRAQSDEGDDPALAAFLGFLAKDLANHPEHLQVIDAGLVERLQGVVSNIEINLNEPLPDEDA